MQRYWYKSAHVQILTQRRRHANSKLIDELQDAVIKLREVLTFLALLVQSAALLEQTYTYGHSKLIWRVAGCRCQIERWPRIFGRCSVYLLFFYWYKKYIY